ncbi:MAG: hypothetical protein E6Q25_00050 [Acinetobacter sp.]|nr:MAG: hypothetical protein E6Q25_00050 [Acinetobacter sp.]
MNFFSTLISMTCVLALTACQSTAKSYNGYSGYQIENQTSSTATLNYTLANNSHPEKQQAKLQAACQHVLGKHKRYKITIFNQQEIVAPVAETSQQGITLGQTSTSFGLSQTPRLNHGADDYATHQALETRPRMLKVIRYSCS